MQATKSTFEERIALVRHWPRVHDYTGALLKALLNQKPNYWTGWITSLSQAEFLSLQLRDQGSSKCLTPAGASHALSDVVKLMKHNGWTFSSLASEDLDTNQVPRNPEWFMSCAEIYADFDMSKLGDLAVHPRKGFKKIAVQDGKYIPSYHEIYEGQHRALVFAQKLLDGEVEWSELSILYLYPDRET